jgi:hypothetical protein
LRVAFSTHEEEGHLAIRRVEQAQVGDAFGGADEQRNVHRKTVTSGTRGDDGALDAKPAGRLRLDAGRCREPEDGQ